MLSDAGAEVSGEYYDWASTGRPESPWNHPYHQTLMMKLFLCSRGPTGEVDTVHLTFADALEVIRKLDRLTLGVPKIVYLVGWQFSGHDSRYPAWSEVNAALAGDDDATPLDGLRRLITEARRHHTTVSLHINMIDAFPDSPLWQSYLDLDIVAKDEDGQPIPGEVFAGMQSYQLSYAREWETGMARRRIDALLEMIPELTHSGTVHIDAFHSIRPAAYHEDGSNDLMSPYLGYSDDREVATQRKIFRYWRSRGIDVTTECSMYHLSRDPFIGLQPAVWWYLPENFLTMTWPNKPDGLTVLPPELYCGTPMHAEEEVLADPVGLSGLLEAFCLRAVPWLFENHGDATRYDRGTLSLDGDDIFAPVLWRDRSIVAYSASGYRGRAWTLPASWAAPARVTVSPLGIAGRAAETETWIETDDGVIRLDLAPGTGVVIDA